MRGAHEVARRVFHRDDVRVRRDEVNRRCGRDLPSGARGYVVEHDGEFRGLGDGGEVSGNALLTRPRVVRRGREYAGHAGIEDLTGEFH